jgi:methyltransferase (TIGR00027 family)
MSDPKWSAEGVATLRAASLLSEKRVQHGDHLAVELIGGWYRAIARHALLRALVVGYYNRAIPGISCTHLARTRFFDEEVFGAIDAGCSQLVILGAGLDSRAYRMAERGRTVDTFEVDLPANSRRKRERVARALGALPAHVRYVEAELGASDLRAVLAEAGVDSSRPAVVLLEGVAPYLTGSALASVLEAVRGLAPGSVFLFDYFYREVFSHPERFPRARSHFRQMKSKGEEYRSGVDPEAVPDLLRASGLVAERVLSAGELDAQYLMDAAGTQVGRSLGYLGVARARVPGAPS